MNGEMSPCSLKNLDHVCVAVQSIRDTLTRYQSLFHIEAGRVEEIPDQGVRACLINIGHSRLELIEPMDQDGSIARFLERRGDALHHVAFEVENISDRLSEFQKRGVALIDQIPRKGAAGIIGFLHPKATGGVLIELVEKES
jgi:methylmalonyl-CoA epimerase